MRNEKAYIMVADDDKEIRDILKLLVTVSVVAGMIDCFII